MSTPSLIPSTTYSHAHTIRTIVTRVTDYQRNEARINKDFMKRFLRAFVRLQRLYVFHPLDIDPTAWRRTILRICKEVVLWLGLASAILSQCLALPNPMETKTQKIEAALFYISLLLFLSGAALATVTSQCGQVMYVQITSNEGEDTQTFEEYLMKEYPSLSRASTVALNLSAAGIAATTLVGGASFVVGVLLHAESQLPEAETVWVVVAFIVAGVPVALLLLAYWSVAMGFLVAGVRISSRIDALEAGRTFEN